MHRGPQVQSALLEPTEDDGTYEDISPSLSDSFILGPPLDYFDFDYPIQPDYSYPIAFPPDAALSAPLPPHVAQLYDYTALYNGQPGMDLNPLSSQSYSEAPYEKTDSIELEGGNTPLYGGLMPTRSPSGDASSTRATRPVRSRKSSKREDPNSMSLDESTASRQRGRPRLDTRDQTAAERRRTQIRLAQRAYRQRKETTISGLNKRVSELERTIDEMNKSFLDFNDKAIASGIRRWEPSLAQDLKKTLGHFLESARQITEVDEEEEEQVPILSARVFGSDETPRENRSRTSRRPRQSLQPLESSSHGETARAAPWGYDIVDQGQTELDGTPRSRSGSEQAQQMTTLDEGEWSSDTPMRQYRVELPETTLVKRWADPPVGKSLPLPSSYAIQETSFARRLLRQSLESAFRLLTNPNSLRQDIVRLCKFTFYFSNSQRIIEHLQALMLRTVREDMELWEAPQLHLGGAGLHYSRVGLDGIDSSGPPAWWAKQAPIGPQRPVEPETPVSKELNMQQIVELAGFDGEWFDSNDVEQYLRSKGLYLNAQSSWVEIELPDLLASESQVPTVSSPTESSIHSSRDQQSPRRTDSLFSNNPVMEGQDYSWTADSLNPSNFSNANMDLPASESDPFGALAPDAGEVFDPQLYLDPILPDILPTFNTNTKKFIDVENFLSALVNTSVCLGRTPGFRRNAIDSALAQATHYGW